MDEIKILQKIIMNTVGASKVCDIRFATVNNTSPLTITLEAVQLTVSEPAVVALESLKQLTIDDIEHDHQYIDDDEGGSTTRTTEKALANIQCYLNGTGLGRTEDNKIIIRKGIGIGDKVAVIRANGGQTYLIIGRV